MDQGRVRNECREASDRRVSLTEPVEVESVEHLGLDSLIPCSETQQAPLEFSSGCRRNTCQLQQAVGGLPEQPVELDVRSVFI